MSRSPERKHIFQSLNNKGRGSPIRTSFTVVSRQQLVAPDDKSDTHLTHRRTPPRSKTALVSKRGGVLAGPAAPKAKSPRRVKVVVLELKQSTYAVKNWNRRICKEGTNLTADARPGQAMKRPRHRGYKMGPALFREIGCSQGSHVFKTLKGFCPGKHQGTLRRTCPTMSLTSILINVKSRHKPNDARKRDRKADRC